MSANIALRKTPENSKQWDSELRCVCKAVVVDTGMEIPTLRLGFQDAEASIYDTTYLSIGEVGNVSLSRTTPSPLIPI